MRDAVWREYRQGQERDKKPSLRYLAVQQHAIGEVAFKPYDEGAAAASAPYLLNAVRYRLLAIERGEGDPLEGLAALPDATKQEETSQRGGQVAVLEVQDHDE